jgi:hypothetical protein
VAQRNASHLDLGFSLRADPRFEELLKSVGFDNG